MNKYTRINTRGLIIWIAVISTILNIGFYKLGQKTIKNNNRLEIINSYNKGYRSGALNITSELIECQGVTDKKVKLYNDQIADTMDKMGELDKSPYPCEE